MITKNDGLTLIGFILFFLGMLSIFLALVGLQFSFLTFLDRLGRLPSFLIKVVMVVIGLIIIYLSKIHYPPKDGGRVEQARDTMD